MKFLVLLGLVLLPSRVHAEPAPEATMRAYILEAVAYLAEHYGERGYASGTYFTHDLDYVSAAEIKESAGAPKTMCVAAVAEVIITAINLYAESTDDKSVYTKIPARSWSKSAPYDLRPYIFMYDGSKSSGTADALVRFGLGKTLPFADLQPGDFINFNRTNGTGHAVVFMGFINGKGEIMSSYDAAKVVGFKYFSSQGHDDGGLGFRWAYFEGKCPAKRAKYRPRDCTVIRSEKLETLNTGTMFAPANWRAAATHKAMLVSDKTDELVRAAPMSHGASQATKHDQQAARARAAVDADIPITINSKYDGVVQEDE